MKKTLALALIFFILAGCAAPAAHDTAVPETRNFTDSLGRTMAIPTEIGKIAVSGQLAQIIVFSLAPDMLVGIANAWDKSAEEYLSDKYYDLPVLGQLYGGRGDLNLETLLASGAQIVVDIGEITESLSKDLDTLSEQTGIPFVHISASLGTMGETYRLLGELLGMENEAAVLAQYCESIYRKTVDISGNTNKPGALYLMGDKGLNVIAKGSYHAEVIDMLTLNLANIDAPSSKGTGNEVDMEQIIKWNPDIIFFAPGSIHDTVSDMPEWQSISAIKNGRYYEVPSAPYNWLGFPPSVQRYMGMIWLSQLLYSETAQYDLFEEVCSFYKLFYHCELTREQYNILTANSFGG